MSTGPSTIAACLLAIVVGQSALAGGPADVASDQTAPVQTAPATDWSGFYFGFALATPRDGNSWRQASDGLELLPGPWENSSLVLSLGHDWQRERLTYGVQLSYGNGEYIANPEDAAFINCSACATEADDIFTVTGRVGLAAGQTHVFATGGLARGNVTATYDGGLQVFEDTAMTGWTLGVGVEQRIGDNLSLALSYDRVDLGTLALPDYLPTGETEVDFGRVQVGMNVHW